RDARRGRNEQGGLIAGYAWAQAAPGRVLVVYDFHTLCNTPGHWRALIDALPPLRKPRGGIPDGASEEEIAETLAMNPLAGHASLVVFVGPAWELTPPNPLRGALPVLAFAPPDRESIRDTLDRLHPLNGDAESCVDALCGLSADAAEQAAAEVLARTRGQYVPAMLRESKRAVLRQAGLESWPAVAELGGLAGLQS